MPTALYRTPTQNNLQYTLASGLAQGATTLTLNTDVTGVVRTPGVCVIDRVDASGNKTPSSREYISFTGQSTTTLSGLTKGLGGSTDQAHNVGAIVEFIPDVVWADSIYTAITFEHSTTGGHQSLPSINNLTTFLAAIPSQASINQINTNSFIASAASLQGVVALKPTWIFGGNVSGASSALGYPMVMPIPGTIAFLDAVTRIGSSNASLFLDITKNGLSITGANASVGIFNIPVNGTFVSLQASNASVGLIKFVAGDVFNFSILNKGSMAYDLVVKFYAR